MATDTAGSAEGPPQNHACKTAQRDIQHGEESRLLRVLKNWTSLLGIVSALFYGLLWLAYYQFYSAFAITPDEAGFDKIELLSQALVGPTFFFLVLFLLSVISAIVLVLYWVLAVVLDAAASREVLYQGNRNVRTLTRVVKQRTARQLKNLVARRRLLVSIVLRNYSGACWRAAAGLTVGRLLV